MDNSQDTTTLHCRSMSGHRLWVHDLQLYLPAQFEAVEVTERQAEFLKAYASCEIELEPGTGFVFDRKRDYDLGPTLEEFCAMGHEIEAYPPEGCRELDSPAMLELRASREADAAEAAARDGADAEPDLAYEDHPPADPEPVAKPAPKPKSRRGGRRNKSK